MTNQKSIEYFDRAMKVIPEQTMTLAKAAHNYPNPHAPKYVKSASGCEITDVDGNRFIDYTMGLGPFILGYNYPRINEAVVDQLASGTIYSLPHYLEVELAEEITRIIPCGEKVRLYKNGADVAGLAARLARSYTGKRHILQSGYHGHHEWYAFQLRAAGVLDEIKEYTHAFEYNNLDQIKGYLEQYKGDVAAIFVENAFTPPEAGFLEDLRTLATAKGVVLIYDEMWTGFRFGLGGYQGYSGVTPDIGLFSKAIANGFPISVITGKLDIMDHFSEIWGFTTFAGETLSIRAALETIDEIRTKDVKKHIWDLGEQLKKGCQTLIDEAGLSDAMSIAGYPCRFNLSFTDTEKNYKNHIQDVFLEHGILWNTMFVTSFSHQSSHIDQTLQALKRGLATLG